MAWLPERQNIRRFSLHLLAWEQTDAEYITMLSVVVYSSMVGVMFYAFSIFDLLYQHIYDQEKHETIETTPKTLLFYQILHLICDAIFCLLIVLPSFNPLELEVSVFTKYAAFIPFYGAFFNIKIQNRVAARVAAEPYSIERCSIAEDYMVDSLSFIFDFFAERHIALKEEWLVDVTTFLLSTFEAEQSLPRIAGLVFEQWKYSDLKESSYPTFSQLNLDSADVKFSFNHPLVLQINSIVDIGAPFHFQFTALVSEFIDDTGFDPLPEMEQERYSNVLAASQRRMLLLTLSDGESDFRAIEYKSIKQLSLLLKPGCKVVTSSHYLKRADHFRSLQRR
ncbi:hypothetical protein NECAME_08039 [Necator americanus]|uniref:RecQ-mediated genome instability protein 1 n=1 Tax=Necator americanus TaxID=51031 RepID=W2TMV9_NECAM|nr:hypothetical protein NECAME_08039 [Necator americanus]ETN82327.1 hypothetical protein NECAME_08039 [Necator americanus]